MNIVDMVRVPDASRRMSPNAILTGAAALIFAASAAATVRRYMYMATMQGMPMAGHWMISALWTPMCGQTWFHTAASFAGMWAVMMPAMMLPVLVPMLWRDREANPEGLAIYSAVLSILAGAGYFLIWLLTGIAIFPLGAGLAAIAMWVPALARALPAAAGAIVVLASLLQFTQWKAQRLACWRETQWCARRQPENALAALFYGIRLALRCGSCCGNWMAVLLVAGVMDLRVMAVVTAAIAAERIAPHCDRHHARIARVIGMAGVAAGVLMLVRAL
jgi:predicted metal-binding membrane protein